MFGLDEYLVSLSDGTSLLAVVAVAILLGLRHATDPDHLAAVTTLIAADERDGRRHASLLGAAWGAGHALTILALGLPVVAFHAHLPRHVEQAAETVVGLVIIVLGTVLLVRWRRGRFHAHWHEHDGTRHRHLHSHAEREGHRHRHVRSVRSPLTAFGIGLVHGTAGSAGVGVLIVATVDVPAYAVTALGLLAGFTAVSMIVLSSGFSLALQRRRAHRGLAVLTPTLGAASAVYGAWYVLSALGWGLI